MFLRNPLFKYEYLKEYGNNTTGPWKLIYKLMLNIHT